KHSAPAGAGDRVCLSLGTNQSADEVQLRTLAAAPLQARVLKSLGSAEEPKLSASSSTTKSDSGTQNWEND
ncbi:tRNA pseudouridine synthase A, partial [Clarias magur]